MDTITTRQSALQAQVSATLRFAVAAAVAGVLAMTWIVAEQASHQAVQTATAAFSRAAAHTVQPAVAIAVRREPASKRT